jgi:hypothetical protein
VAITARGRREELLQPTRKGDPEMPLSERELEQKFMELAAPVAGWRTSAASLVFVGMAAVIGVQIMTVPPSQGPSSYRCQTHGSLMNWVFGRMPSTPPISAR